MAITYPVTKVAAAHVSPIYNDAERSVDKACSLIAEAAGRGIQLLAFPETFIPGYPHWAPVVRPIESDDLFQTVAAGAIYIDGPEISRICAAARRHEIYVSIGFVEGTKISVGCVWNSNVLVGPDGAILNHHRKLVPSFTEKLVFASGDGSGLHVSDTEIGRIGMLICGENANPLARYTMMAQGEQIHISTYPSVSPALPSKNRGGFDLQETIRIRAASHSFEAKAFNIVVSTPFDKTARDALAEIGEETAHLFDNGSQAVSMIVNPLGQTVSDVLSADEGLCVAEVDLSDAVAPKRMHDVVGYFNRFDIFDLSVNRAPNRPISYQHPEQAKARRAEISGPANGQVDGLGGRGELDRQIE